MKANPWQPMTKPIDLKHLGKLIEELGELQAALARCIVQGIDECEPVTGKPNRQWLIEELSDVYAGIHLLNRHFDVPIDMARYNRKVEMLKSWHGMRAE